MAKDVLARLAHLQVANPTELMLLACEETHNDAEAEAEIHRRCAMFRIRGEWFMPDGPVLDVVANMGIGLAQCSLLVERAAIGFKNARDVRERSILERVYAGLKELARREEEKLHGQPVLA